MTTAPSRTWRVTAQTRVPTEISAAADGGLPEQIQPVSRVKEQTAELGGVPVRLRPIEAPAIPGAIPDFRWSWAEVIAEVKATAGYQAIETAMLTFEAVFESLSFQLLVPLQIESLEALDVTAPTAVGDEREIVMFPIGAGYPLRRFRPASIQMAGVETVREPDLSVTLDQLTNRERAALDWYIKSLGAPFQMDQYIFLWIAAETLWAQSGVSVEGPYLARCGHAIPNCPECGKSTSRQVRGQSIQQFFTEQFGLDAHTARRLWQARQVMHGAERFDSALLDALDELIQVLRAVVNLALKRVLGGADSDPPVIDAGQLSIAPHMALGGTRKIGNDDLGNFEQAEECG